MKLRFSCMPFSSLTNTELYEILALRQEVFVVEQNCPYQDADGKDQDSWHLMAYSEDDVLVAYTRLLPPGLDYADYSAIGRVITRSTVRGTGAGKSLMKKSMELCRFLFGPKPIKIGAQTYLLAFYTALGFNSTGEEYLEDDIPHTKMTHHFEE
ncbi:MAG: GNAT family N-acetyltransferase [Saprospiraceae bacterium]